MKTVLITGGSRGIGLAIANRLSADGFRVAVSYRSTPPSSDEPFLSNGGLAIQSDVSHREEMRVLVDSVLEKFCQLDTLVCNAGVAWQGLTQDMDEGAYRRVMGTDLDGAFYACQAVLPHMIARKSGRIVTISSMWGQTGGSCEAAYSAAKAGIIGLTKALAKEVAPSGVTVNCVAPGVINTDMNAHLGPETLAALAGEIPLGRLGTAEDVAGCVAFLCSVDADYLTGQVLAPNGGLVI